MNTERPHNLPRENCWSKKRGSAWANLQPCATARRPTVSPRGDSPAPSADRGVFLSGRCGLVKSQSPKSPFPPRPRRTPGIPEGSAEPPEPPAPGGSCPFGHPRRLRKRREAAPGTPITGTDDAPGQPRCRRRHRLPLAPAPSAAARSGPAAAPRPPGRTARLRTNRVAAAGRRH